MGDEGDESRVDTPPDLVVLCHSYLLNFFLRVFSVILSISWAFQPERCIVKRFNSNRAVFSSFSKAISQLVGFALLHFVFVKQISHHFIYQSEVIPKPKPATCISFGFPLFHWIIGLSASVSIGRRNHLGFPVLN